MTDDIHTVASIQSEAAALQEYQVQTSVWFFFGGGFNGAATARAFCCAAAQRAEQLWLRRLLRNDAANK